MAPFKFYGHLSELVKVYPCLYYKQEKDFKKEVKLRAWDKNSQGARPKKLKSSRTTLEQF